MSTLILLLLLLLAASSADMQQDAEDDYEAQPENFDGRSFFFLGTLFRRWRDRWLALQNPAPLYAGAAFPLNGYFNCPSYGCNPAAIGPQPGGFYPTYYVSPLQQQQQQQQQAQGNSNVYIYQTDQNTGSSIAPDIAGCDADADADADAETGCWLLNADEVVEVAQGADANPTRC
ncbi:uncharacterized protein Dvir_GJ24593 [Drosophila virilis]|uniref:Uncharacterized protein n=1 Tax=Drosophila virilis TaxID=7244 RepID=B4LZP9_DROVI|nr:uncharacterized protein Dvir_GJ24593 [Drosophila virilis]